jgi:hypothetical protein
MAVTVLATEPATEGMGPETAQGTVLAIALLLSRQTLRTFLPEAETVAEMAVVKATAGMVVMAPGTARGTVQRTETALIHKTVEITRSVCYIISGWVFFILVSFLFGENPGSIGPGFSLFCFCGFKKSPKKNIIIKSDIWFLVRWFPWWCF